MVGPFLGCTKKAGGSLNLNVIHPCASLPRKRATGYNLEREQLVTTCEVEALGHATLAGVTLQIGE